MQVKTFAIAIDFYLFIYLFIYLICHLASMFTIDKKTNLYWQQKT